MRMIAVDSSAIRAIGYADGVLGVLFHTSPTVYMHPGVPYAEYVALMNAESKGTFYNQQIRGKYK